MEPLFGPYGGSAVEILERVVDAGGNAVWFHGFNAEAAEGCAHHGVAACVELKTFRADFSARPELVPVGPEGEPIRYGRLVQGVCLSQKAFLDEIEATLVDGLERFHPTGIWLDYLTYGGWFEAADPDLQQNCFCPSCVEDFCSSAGVDTDSPADILSNHEREWVRHKCRRIASLAARYVAVIRREHPDCIVGAYMCPWRPDEFGGALGAIFGQDYDLLAASIDVFTPLIYARKCGRPPEWGRGYLETSGSFIPASSKIQLILDALDFPDSLAATSGASRPSWGAQLFGGVEIFGEPANAATLSQAARRFREAWAGS